VTRWTIFGFVLGFLLGLAVFAPAHGLITVPSEPGGEVCACSSAIRSDGTVDVCDSGTEYYTTAPRSGSAPLEPKLLSITRLRRLTARLRLELAGAPL